MDLVKTDKSGGVRNCNGNNFGRDYANGDDNRNLTYNHILHLCARPTPRVSETCCLDVTRTKNQGRIRIGGFEDVQRNEVRIFRESSNDGGGGRSVK